MNNIDSWKRTLVAAGLTLLWRLRRTVPPPARASSPIDNACTTSEGNEATQADSVALTNLELRAFLRRFPYWRTGHYYLAENSLTAGDVATAYASAQCLRSLSNCSPQHESEWQYLLGRCFLRHGDGTSALTHLRAARALLPSQFVILEDEAAALMLIGEKAKAAETLQQIPPEKISPEGRVTLSFLTQPRTEH